MTAEFLELGAGGSNTATAPADAAIPLAALKRSLTALGENAALFSSCAGVNDAVAKAQQVGLSELSRVEHSIQNCEDRQRRLSERLKELDRERFKIMDLQHNNDEQKAGLLAEKQRWQRSIEDNGKEREEQAEVMRLAQVQVRMLQVRHIVPLASL
jgi:flagellar motility protein MotE (MotC chaperone)